MRISDKRLFCREFKFQLVFHKRSKIFFHFFAVCLASNYPYKKIICISHIFQSPVLVIHVHRGREFSHFLLYVHYLGEKHCFLFLILYGTEFLAQSDCLFGEFCVLRIIPSSFSHVEVLCIFTHVLVEPVEVDISQYGAYDTSLRRTRISIVECKVLHIAGLEEFPYQPQKAFV